MEDLYEILGIPHDADGDTITLAYRQLALERPPERRARSAAEAQVLERAARAYLILSSPEKRAAYDRDLTAHTTERGRPDGEGSGPALVLPLAVSLSEVFLGATRAVPVPCAECSGSGAVEVSGKPATVPCTTCAANGRYRRLAHSPQGPAFVEVTCDDCGGTGERPLRPCRACGGTGRDPAGGTVVVNIPPGVATGDVLPAIPGQRHGPGAPALQLLVQVQDEEGPFRRDGDDVVVDVTIHAARAVRGGEVDVPTLAGRRRVLVPPDVSTGHVLRLEGFGLPSRHRASFGDQLVRVVVAAEDGAADGAPADSTGRGGQDAARRFRLPAGVRARLSLDGAGWTRGALRAAGDRAESLAARLAGRLHAVLDARRREPPRATAAVLDRLARAVEGAGIRETAGLHEVVDRRLAADVAGLQRLRDLVGERERILRAGDHDAGIRRASGHAATEAFMDLAFLAVWASCTWTLFRQFALQLSVQDAFAPAGPTIPAAAVALAIGFAAFAAKDALWGSVHVVFWSRIAPDRSGRSAAGFVAGALVAGGAVATVWSSAAAQPAGPAALLGGLYGLLVVGALVLAATRLDGGIVAAGHLLHAAALGLSWIACTGCRYGSRLLDRVLAGIGVPAPEPWPRDVRDVPADPIPRNVLAGPGPGSRNRPAAPRLLPPPHHAP